VSQISSACFPNTNQQRDVRGVQANVQFDESQRQNLMASMFSGLGYEKTFIYRYRWDSMGLSKMVCSQTNAQCKSIEWET